MKPATGYRIPVPQLLFNAGLTERTHTNAFVGLRRWGPYDNTRVDIRDGSLLFLFPEVQIDRARDIWFQVFQGVGRFKGFSETFKKEVGPSAVEHFRFNADLDDPASAAAAYRQAVHDWASGRRSANPSLAFVVVPKTNRWEVDRPYYEAKAALASMSIPSQMVTTELLQDQSRLEWAAGDIALGAFAKLGGVPWAVQAPTDDADLVIGVGRQEIGPEGDRQRSFGYAVSFVSNGLYQKTWSMTPAANEESYLRRLSEAIEAALTEGVDDLDQPPGRVVVHLAKRAGVQEIEAVQEAMNRVGLRLPAAFLRLDDSSMWDIADTGKDDFGAGAGTVVRLSERAALLQVEGVTNRGAPGGPLLVALDSRSTVDADQFDGLISQAYRLAYASWRSFTGKRKPVTILYGEQLASLVGHMSRIDTWNPHTLPPELKSRPWFL